MSKLANDLHIFINNVECIEKSQTYVFERMNEINKTLSDLTNNLMIAMRNIEGLQRSVMSLQAKRLNSLGTEQVKPAKQKKPKEIKEDNSHKTRLNDIHSMSVRLCNVLKNDGYEYLEDLSFPLDEKEILKIPNLGLKSLFELKKILVAYVGKKAFKISPYINCADYIDYLSDLYYLDPNIHSKQDLEYLKEISPEVLVFLKNYIEVYSLDEEGISKFLKGNEYLIEYFCK